MKFSTTIYLFLVLFFVILALTRPVSVQANSGTTVITIPNPLQAESIEEIIEAISGLLQIVAVGVGFIMVIWSGIMIMTAGGSEEQVKKGKKTLMWTVIGVAIVVAVNFIIGIINELLGG